MTTAPTPPLPIPLAITCSPAGMRFLVRPQLLTRFSTLPSRVSYSYLDLSPVD
jgi:hypothetical protein